MTEPWYLIFPSRDALTGGPAWWQRLLHPGYPHVWACRAAGDNATLVVNHTGLTLQLAVMPMPLLPFVKQKADEQRARVICALAAPVDPTEALRGPMTCVEVAKALLGIRAPWIITPYQLARHLTEGAWQPLSSKEMQHG